jgi:formylglycine-generating enzyme required for sulfatase activity
MFTNTSYPDLKDKLRRTEVRRALVDAVGDAFELLPETVNNWLPYLRHRNSSISFRFIPAGEFDMGFSAAEEGAARRIKNPLPKALEVHLDRMRPVTRRRAGALLMSCLPVTTEIYERLMHATPAGYQFRHGAVLATFGEAVRFTDVVGCSLPSEVEWEYACRGGRQSLFPWGNELCNREELSQWLGSEFGVGFEARCRSNAFGLYGLLSGEWCEDEFHVTHDEGAVVERGQHVVKGGGAMWWPWQNDEWIWCLPAMRLPESGLLEDKQASFRLVVRLSM